MLTFTQRITDNRSATVTATLPFEERQKSRLRIQLDDGRDAGIILERGACLRHGDLLQSADGTVLRIIAAPEPVACVYCDDPVLLARACYHLGNRHVPLQIDGTCLRLQRDHVLEHMLAHLGLHAEHETAAFEPENGAYGQHHDHHHEH